MKKSHFDVTSKFTSQFTRRKLIIACNRIAAVRRNVVFMPMVSPPKVQVRIRFAPVGNPLENLIFPQLVKSVILAICYLFIKLIFYYICSFIKVV